MIFKLKARATISVYTEVKAKTLEQAIEIAKERNMMQIINDSFYTEEEFWCADELDCTAQNIEEDN